MTAEGRYASGPCTSFTDIHKECKTDDMIEKIVDLKARYWSTES
jgi:hypothetical protein